MDLRCCDVKSGKKNDEMKQEVEARYVMHVEMNEL